MKTSTRNWWAIFVDYVFFGLGLTFAHTGTVLPSFAATLTSSKLLIGMTNAVWLGTWLLPQMFAANFLTDKPRKYGYMVGAGAAGRWVFWLFAFLLVFGWLARWPLLMMAVFLLGIAWFALTDAVAAIAWFDIFGRAMSPSARGRLIGTGQLVDGILAIAAGWLVGYFLSERGLPYPLNYAAIFGLAGLAFFISWLGCMGMVEVPEAAPDQQPAQSLRDYWPRLREVWTNDKNFSRAITIRLLVGLSELAAPFYIIHATQVTKVGGGIVGGLAAVGSVGVALAGLLLGQVAARQGSHRVIQITAWLSIVPPVLGLVLSFLQVSPMFVWAYIACYLIIGMVNGSTMLGYFNYILDSAPPGGRPTYMGLANTLSGAIVAAPIVGGWILDYSSYPILFALTLIGMLAAGAMAVGLKPVKPRAYVPDEAASPVV